MWPAPPDATRQWLEAVRVLHGLAARQVAAIEADAEDLSEILAAKDAAYRRADEAMQQVTADGAPTEPWASDIRAELEAIGGLEQCSESLLSARLDAVHAELRSLQRGQTAAIAYTPAGKASPRFLDDLR